jgi:hypothetical protein
MPYVILFFGPTNVGDLRVAPTLAISGPTVTVHAKLAERPVRQAEVEIIETTQIIREPGFDYVYQMACATASNGSKSTTRSHVTVITSLSAMM